MSPSEDPACGSESAIVPYQRPSITGLANRSTCSGVPWVAIRLALPWARKGYAVTATLAAENQLDDACCTTNGSCMPPSSAGKTLVGSPEAVYAASASATSGGWTTVPSSPT